MRTAVFVIGALLLAGAASAQEAPKVWTNADLEKPMRPLRQAEPDVVAAMKARADYIPLMGSSSAAAASRASLSVASGPPAPRSVEGLYARELALQRATAPKEPVFYAPQPLYPFVSVIYSNQPYRPARRPCPVPPVFQRR